MLFLQEHDTTLRYKGLLCGMDFLFLSDMFPMDKNSLPQRQRRQHKGVSRTGYKSRKILKLATECWNKDCQWMSCPPLRGKSGQNRLSAFRSAGWTQEAIPSVVFCSAKINDDISELYSSQPSERSHRGSIPLISSKYLFTMALRSR